MLIATTPSMLGIVYTVAEQADRDDFWRWQLWPSFVPLAVGLVLFVFLLAGWHLPGMPRDAPEPPPTRGALLEAIKTPAPQPETPAESYEAALADRPIQRCIDDGIALMDRCVGMTNRLLLAATPTLTPPTEAEVSAWERRVEHYLASHDPVSLSRFRNAAALPAMSTTEVYFRATDPLRVRLDAKIGALAKLL